LKTRESYFSSEMSARGQTEKNSVRAYVFRFVPKNRHHQHDPSARPVMSEKCPITDIKARKQQVLPQTKRTFTSSNP